MFNTIIKIGDDRCSEIMNICTFVVIFFVYFSRIVKKEKKKKKREQSDKNHPQMMEKKGRGFLNLVFLSEVPELQIHISFYHNLEVQSTFT